MRSNLYGIFLKSLKPNGGFRFAMSRSKKRSIAYVKKEGWGEVRSMPLPFDTNAWDCPTFRLCSELIFELNGTADLIRRLTDQKA